MFPLFFRSVEVFFDPNRTAFAASRVIGKQMMDIVGASYTKWIYQ